MFSRLFITVTLALLAASSPLVVRNSPVSIPLARRFNVTGAKNILAADQARAKFLKSGTKSAQKAAASSGSLPVTNGAVTYTAAVCATFLYSVASIDDRAIFVQINVGSPPTVCKWI